MRRSTTTFKAVTPRNVEDVIADRKRAHRVLLIDRGSGKMLTKGVYYSGEDIRFWLEFAVNGNIFRRSAKTIAYGGPWVTIAGNDYQLSEK
jgi:hypothetical protein